MGLFDKHSKEKSVFRLYGKGIAIRTDTELEFIDKKAADNAFMKYKKEILDTFLLDKGFLKWKTNAYVRLNSIGLLEYIELQKERYGSKTFCVNFCIMPLYCQQEYLVIGLGERLGSYISGKDFWWDYATEEIAKNSFENVMEAMRLYLLPWFQDLSTEKGYRKRLINDSNKKFIGYPNAKWLTALETVDKGCLIEKSIQRLKLPKKLFHSNLND